MMGKVTALLLFHPACVWTHWKKRSEAQRVSKCYPEGLFGSLLRHGYELKLKE